MPPSDPSEQRAKQALIQKKRSRFIRTHPYIELCHSCRQEKRKGGDIEPKNTPPHLYPDMPVHQMKERNAYGEGCKSGRCQSMWGRGCDRCPGNPKKAFLFLCGWHVRSMIAFPPSPLSPYLAVASMNLHEKRRINLFSRPTSHSRPCPPLGVWVEHFSSGGASAEGEEDREVAETVVVIPHEIFRFISLRGGEGGRERGRLLRIYGGESPFLTERGGGGGDAAIKGRKEAKPIHIHKRKDGDSMVSMAQWLKSLI